MPNWKKVITSGSDALLNEITASGGIDTTNLDVSELATYNTVEYSNSNTMKFNQRYTGAAIGSYFSNGEYQKVITITPDGSSQNYQVIGRITAQNAAETHTIYFNAALRSNTLPDLDWTIYYDEEYNGARYIDPQLWTKETSTAGFIFAFKTLATIYGNVTVDIDVVPRAASQKANVSINSVQDSEQTSVDSGFTANDMLKVVSKNQTDVNFSAEISSSNITIDDWGSVSASLSTLTSDVANIDSNVTLQDATDNGSTTTNNITIDSTGDARLVLDRAANSNDSEIEFKTNGTTNWSIGTGQVGSETDLTFKGQDGSNYIRINQSGQADFLSAVTSSDITIDDWGSVSASLASLDASVYGDSDVTSHINSLNVHSGSHLGTADTDDLPEGSTNLYYTDGRVKTKLNAEGVLSGSSQVDINSTTGDLTTLGTVTSGDVTAILPSGVISGSAQLGIDDTDDVDEGSSNLYYTDGRVKTKLNAESVISGSTYSSPSQGTLRATINDVNSDVDLGLQVGDSPTFTDLTLTGNLTVEGTRTELQVTELNVEDKNITVASGAANSAAADGAGITIGGANESLTWDHANSRFTFSDDLRVNNSLNIGSVSNANTDTDKFLVLDSNGNVDFRTGNEVRSDIGAAGTANLSGAPSELAFFGSSTEVTSSRRISLLNTASSDAQSLLVQGQIQVINDPTRNVGGSSPMQITVGSGSTGDINNPQYDSFIALEQESAVVVGLRANGDAPTAAQFKMRTDVNDAYSIGRLTNPYGANTFRIKPTIIAEGGLSITGSLTISGSNTLINQGPAEFSGSVSITTADQVQASTDTDKFLVLDGDQIKYRSGTEVRSDIGATAAQNLQSVTDNGSSTTNVITFSNFVLSTPTNNNASSDKILVLDGSNRSKFRTRDNLKSDLNLDSITTPIQLVVDTKALSSGYVSWFGVSDIQQNSNRGYTTWIAPEAGYIERVVISPEQTNTTTANIDLGLYVNGSQQSTDVSVAMGAAGTNKTFTFGSSNYSFSQGERLSLSFDKNTNTADLYNVMVIFRLNS